MAGRKQLCCLSPQHVEKLQLLSEWATLCADLPIQPITGQKQLLHSMSHPSIGESCKRTTQSSILFFQSFKLKASDVTCQLTILTWRILSLSVFSLSALFF